jgi:DNA-binding beta-propeller fold protein YncE
MVSFSHTTLKTDATPNQHRGSIKRILLGVLKCICVAFCLLVLAIAFVVLRGPHGSQRMRLISDLDIPAGRSLLAGTDYATVDGRTLFFAYGTANAILAVDTETGSVRTFAPNLPGVHGVAFSKRSNLVFASMGGANGIAVLDRTEGSLERIVPAGIDPDGIVFDQKADIAYVGNGASDSATLLPAVDLDHPITIPLGGSPEFPQVDESTGLIYQPLEDKNEVVVIDPVAHGVVSRFPISPCEKPKGSALDSEDHVLFVGCSNRLLAVMNLADGHLIATVPIGRFVDVVAWDAALHRVYTANAGGSMTVIKRQAKGLYKAVETVRTRPGGHTLAIDALTHRVYVVCSGLREAHIVGYEPILNSENSDH